MKKRLLRFLSYVLVAAVSSAATFGITFYLSESRWTGEFTKLDALESLIDQVFIGEKDLTRMEDAAASAMVAATGDRWSYYIPASQMQAYEERSTNSYAGIGATVVARENGLGCVISEVKRNSPASDAELLPGDILVEVNGEDVTELPLQDIVDRVKGEPGTEVELKLLRDGEAFEKMLIRAVVETEVSFGEMMEGNIAYISIENFDDRCAQETIDIIESMMEEGAEGIVFDVRGNPGGYAHELTDLLDYLLPEGIVFQSEDYTGKKETITSDAACVNLPMAILVDADTYSAAEFFAAAMQENGCPVIGEVTSGKGYFQQTFLLPDGSGAAISTGKYFTPNGVSLIGTGIQPDYEMSTDLDILMKVNAGELPLEEESMVAQALKALEIRAEQ